MNCKVIAVTGGIACGKSTVARFLSELDCDILDTDDLSHDLQGPRGEAVEAITVGVASPVVLRYSSYTVTATAVWVSQR